MTNLIEQVFDKNQTTIYSEYDKFISDLKKVEELTERVPVSLKKLDVNIIKKDVEGDLQLNIPGSVFENNITINNGEYVLRDDAIRSLCDRAKISGQSLTKISRSVLVSFLKECFKVVKDEDGLIIKIGDKVSAILSDGYKVLEVNDVFESANETFKTSLDAVFLSAIISKEIFDAVWEIKKFKSEILSCYSTSLFSSKNTKPIIEVMTSNTGFSGANIYPKLKRGSLKFPIGKPLVLEHKGESSLKKFKENLELVYSLYKKSLKNFEDLKKIRIIHYKDCFKSVAKKIGLPKKYTALALEDFLDEVDGQNSVSAFDIYLGMTEILAYAQSYSKSNTLYLEELLSRALFINWEDYDRMSL